jgi:hypothetical protein
MSTRRDRRGALERETALDLGGVKGVASTAVALWTSTGALAALWSPELDTDGEIRSHRRSRRRSDPAIRGAFEEQHTLTLQWLTS